MFWQYRHRESSFDARSKKLAEVTKTGEIAIETLSRQRDALELRYLLSLLGKYQLTHDNFVLANDSDRIPNIASLRGEVGEIMVGNS